MLSDFVLEKEVIGVGVMTGTSLDGIDVAVCSFGPGRVTKENCRILHYQEHAYPDHLRRRVRQVIDEGSCSLLCQLNVEVSKAIGEAVFATLSSQAWLSQLPIYFVSSHGQTVWHQPPSRCSSSSFFTPSTLQLQCPNTLLSIIQSSSLQCVITHHRYADICYGGEGAPLVPLLDHFVWNTNDTKKQQQQHDDTTDTSSSIVCLLNIGGISNVSIMLSNDCVVGGDCGPGNMVADQLCEAINIKWDDGGHISQHGMVDDTLLNQMKQWDETDYEGGKLPTTGREKYGKKYVEKVLEWEGRVSGGHASLVRTSLAYVALRVATSIQQLIKKDTKHENLKVIVTGGGAKNETLMEELRKAMPHAKITRLREGEEEAPLKGLTEDNKEAVAFALLGLCTLLGCPGNIPSVTGAKQKAVLGTITWANNKRFI